jgi:hypothetical protein
VEERNQGFRTRITLFLFFPRTESPDESLLHQQQHVKPYEKDDQNSLVSSVSVIDPKANFSNAIYDAFTAGTIEDKLLRLTLGARLFRCFHQGGTSN